ncbi:hypothetical protein AB990_01290 [Alkalihalobacillus pseudalcaliphilus]|nr:hypothetical protein AB990_01290 [Alkalihalobacillus pseudalcaliphilus]
MAPYTPVQSVNWFSPNHFQNTVEAQRTLSAVYPAILYGFEDVQVVGYEHALTEAVAIGYLLGQGYSFQQAIEIVQSWWRP